MSGVLRRVDLRSDTVTKPTQQMRRAMFEASVGDDAFGEDRTVCLLEDQAAATGGMEAAVYTPSGTMAKRCAQFAHTRPGDQVFYVEGVEMITGERLAFSEYCGLVPKLLLADYGILCPEQLETAMESTDFNKTPPRLLCLENTHNMSGGMAWLPEEMEAVARSARRYGLALHLDGARIFNAAVAQSVDAKDYTEHVDSVMFCLSKGLSAPVGSLLCGSSDFVVRARAERKRLGGSMRQAGIVAAAGLVALETMAERVGEDNNRGDHLNVALWDIAGMKVEQPSRSTNFVQVECVSRGWTAAEFVQRLESVGVLGIARSPNTVRLVLHRHIDDDDVDYTYTAVAIRRISVADG